MNFSVNKPLPGHDEDAPAYADDKMLIVCDGLGGSGQNTYTVDGTRRSSAYLGSRILSLACQEFFAEHYEEFCRDMRDPSALIKQFKEYISAELDNYVAEKGLKNLVKGKSMHMLPSTLVAIIYKHHDTHTDALVISAGDSRAFALTPENGLQQISTDDVADGIDAFDKVATMTNNVRQDGDFWINYSYVQLPAKCVLFVCSDGCFDYLSSPMELEYRMDFSIAKNFDTFTATNDSVGKFIGELYVKAGLGDDCSMAGAILGYTDVDEVQTAFVNRALYVKEHYIKASAEYDGPCGSPAEAAAQRDTLKKSSESFAKSVDSAIKQLIFEAMMCDLKNQVGSADSRTVRLAGYLRNSGLYSEFKKSIDDENNARNSTSNEKYREYCILRSEVEKAFRVARFEDFISGYSPFDSIFAPSSAGRERMKEYTLLMERATVINRAYALALERFSAVFNEFQAKELKDITSAKTFSKVEEAYAELQKAFYDFITCKKALAQSYETVRDIYMSDEAAIVKEFVDAWAVGFSKYATETRYLRVCSDYTRCMELKHIVDSSHPLSDEEKESRIKEFIEKNSEALISFVKADAELLAGLNIEELKALETVTGQLDALEKGIKAYERKKYSLWMEYKTAYELFNHGIGGNV